MPRNAARILTTHVGSLPQPPGADTDKKRIAAVRGVIAKQREVGLDIINEGEYTKGGDWLSYVDGRFGGFSERARPGHKQGTAPKPLILEGKDREEFAEFYAYAAERGTLFYAPGNQMRAKRPHYVCTGPITYRAHALVEREIETLTKYAGTTNVFLTSTAPASLEVYYGNEFYKTDEEYLFAFAEALRAEYEAIASAGITLQVDDAWLPALWDRIGIPMGLEAFRKRCAVRIEALNHALRNIPEERVRYHLCWGSWHGPHAHDIELKYIVDIMLSVKAHAYLIEAANVRHEHEYVVWDDVKLPEGKILIPGVVTHSTDVVEHPELVAQRIQRFAKRVGRKNLIAGADCGFGGRSHPQIAWAKLKALVEGARIASKSKV
ncbi:MAG TPA: cobalamin-independent methionine synthase II family protein [Gammaproteobacteria bacterium]|jgi:5-methyltetrahydropteroyltriglutamate--homocysteine methyltransferase